MVRSTITLGGLSVLSLLVLACGDPSAVSLAGDEPAGAPDVGTLTDPAAAAPNAAPPTTVVVPATTAAAVFVPTSTALIATSTSLDPLLELVGPFEFLLPKDAQEDLRPTNPLPDYILESKQWLIPGSSVLGVVLQNVSPVFPPEQSVGTFDVNGLAWELFDIGPANGWVIVAVTPADSSFLVVSAQGWTAEEREAPRAVIDEVLGSVRYRGDS